MRPSTLALAGALAMGSGLALAADLPPPPQPYFAPPPPAADCCGGFYLRGDVGVGIVTSDRWAQRPVDNGSTIIASGFSRKELDNTAFVGAGVGYQFNSWLRADITGEFRAGGSAYGTYTNSTTYMVGTDTFNFYGQNNYHGSYESAVGLVNLYADLGTFCGLTPFFGVGVGVASNHLRGFTDTGYAFPNGPTGVVYPVAANLIGNGTTTNLAYAVMAGVAYDVTPGLKLEVGYRYLNLGDAKSGPVYAFTEPKPIEGFRVKDIVSHDFRLGMRWMLGGGVPAPEPAYAPPLVRRG